MKKLPIGIQCFESLRNDDYVYVDKTRLVYNLTRDGKYFFLSRPRRFGKSLLLTTLKAYFEGKRNLFEGLAIMELEHDWKQHPVLHLDLNTGYYTSEDGLMAMFRRHILNWEKQFGITPEQEDLPERFANIITSLKGDLNNLTDITLNNAYASICGITEEELRTAFANDPRQLYRVAVNFNTEKRNIDEWEIRDENKQESK